MSTLAEIFHSSQTATAIRLVEGDHSPALLVCYGHQGHKWFTRGPEVPEHWFPKDTLDADSFAFGVLYCGKPDDSLPRKIGADAWFDRWEAWLRDHLSGQTGDHIHDDPATQTCVVRRAGVPLAAIQLMHVNTGRT